MITQLDQRFFNKVHITGGCWNWIAHRNKAGYGRITVMKKDCTAHRISWMLHHGEIPQGLFVCHHCDNPSCVNPEHLFLGTAKDNAIDRNLKGRNRDDNGEKHPCAKLTQLNVMDIREKLHSGVLCRDLAKEFNVSDSTIRNIKHGRKWRSLL